MKVKNIEKSSVVTIKSQKTQQSKENYQWWKAPNSGERCKQLLATATYLKENQNYRIKQTGMFAKLYGNQSLYSFAGSTMTKMDQTNNLPIDRPTFNLVQSATDTLLSRIGENRPQPVFLTTDGDYKQRKLAKQLNNFIQGEFYSTKAYEKTVLALRDALVTGTGILKVFETEDHKVGIERRLLTELYVDMNESIYGDPRQMYELKLVDRSVLREIAPNHDKVIDGAEEGFPDNAGASSRTVSDQVIIVEGWHLPSGKEAKDGRHIIACSSGVLLDEPYTKDFFPFIFLHYSPRLLGFWAQGLAEQLMGTQIEINTLLYTISKSIKLVGIPRVFVEDGSKVINSSHNNDIGVIVKFRGTKPTYEVAPCVPPEVYGQLQRLINYGYQQCGVSSLDASSEKPAGLNSGEAIRSYDNISVARFNTLSKRYDNIFIELAQLVLDKAQDICEEQGSYTTVYPAKNGIQQVDLPEMDEMKNPFVVQIMNQSALPKDPAGRMETVVGWIQSGMVDLREGRRLMDFPDIEQNSKLTNASEERIYQVLDKIVEDGEYNPPDPFMDLALAQKITVQYYNLYVSANLEEDKCQMLRDFFTQIQALQQQGQPIMPGQGQPSIPPQANPEPAKTSPLVPNSPNPISQASQ